MRFAACGLLISSHESHTHTSLTSLASLWSVKPQLSHCPQSGRRTVFMATSTASSWRNQ